jgi:hypothetical protein
MVTAGAFVFREQGSKLRQVLLKPVLVDDVCESAVEAGVQTFIGHRLSRQSEIGVDRKKQGMDPP